MCTGEARLSRSPGGRTDRAVHQPTPRPSQPLLGGLRHLGSRHLAPRPVLPLASFAITSLPRPPSGSPRAQLTLRPRFVLPPSQQAAQTAPSRPEVSTLPGSPTACLWGGPPELSARPGPAMLPPALLTLAESGIAGGGDSEAEKWAGRARGVAGKLAAASTAAASDWERALHRAAGPRPHQLAAEPSSAHSGRRDCFTVERAMETAAQVSIRTAVFQSGDPATTIFVCFYSKPKSSGAALGHLKGLEKFRRGQCRGCRC